MKCSDKVRYKARVKALLCALSRVKDGAPPLRAYQRPGCKGWHLTKMVENHEEGVVR